MRTLLSFVATLLLGIATPLLSNESESAPDIYFTVDSPDRFIDVLESLTKICGEGDYVVKTNSYQTLSLNVDIYPNYYRVRASKKNSEVRNYNHLVTEEEKKDITYILTTLAKSSLTSLASSKSSLNKAGERIDHIHPFRFLSTVFTDEVLKASVSAIHSRSWVWDQFFDGLNRSLKEESQRNNLTPQQVNEFAASIGLNPSPIQVAVNNKRWKDLILLLIGSVPRSGNTNLYDM